MPSIYQLETHLFFQGSLKDTFCTFETWLFPPKQRDTTIFQGNVQVYNVRIPVFQKSPYGCATSVAQSEEERAALPSGGLARASAVRIGWWLRAVVAGLCAAGSRLGESERERCQRGFRETKTFISWNEYLVCSIVCSPVVLLSLVFLYFPLLSLVDFPF